MKKVKNQMKRTEGLKGKKIDEFKLVLKKAKTALKHLEAKPKTVTK